MSTELRVWMDPMEHSQVLAALHALSPSRCLEWGSGGSTQSLLRHCDFVQQWISVEHDAAWFETVRSSIDDRRLSLHHVAPDQPLPPGKHSEAEQNAWNARAEHEPELMASYVGKPRLLGGGAFDFVLVDGRARRFCIREGFDLLRAGGLLILHDAQRTDYHDVLRAVGSPFFLTPWKQGQVCLLRKPPSSLSG
jgi:hypothetical protein